MFQLFQVFAFEHPKGQLIGDQYVIDPDMEPRQIIGPVFIVAPSANNAGLKTAQVYAKMFEDCDMNRVQYLIHPLGTLQKPTM